MTVDTQRHDTARLQSQSQSNVHSVSIQVVTVLAHSWQWQLASVRLVDFSGSDKFQVEAHRSKIQDQDPQTGYSPLGPLTISVCALRTGVSVL